jgi:hypothetical protein
LILAIMCIGVILVGIVFFGAKQSEDAASLIQKLDTSQTAYEALNAAAKRVQSIYANESGCDPTTLEKRLSAMAGLPETAADLGVTRATGGTQYAAYAVAQPTVAPTNATLRAARENRCVGATGCRQLAIPIDNFYYVVTVGAVSREPTARGADEDCPRDVSIRLSVAAGGTVYFQRFTLTNLCTIASCAGDGFEGLTFTAQSTTRKTLACIGTRSFIPERHYGSLVEADDDEVTTKDLRFARVYLETGGGDIGETTYLYTNPPNSITANSGNGTCSPALSQSQCRYTSCLPALDLNRDGSNNEADLTILEHYLRGYISSLPVNELD